jgi:predicted neutral ceramidase superfamily lipid hydrolase
VAADAAPEFHEPAYTRVLFRAPSLPLCIGYALLASGVIAVAIAFPSLGSLGFLPVLTVVFAVPALLAGALTGPLARALGGSLSTRRAFLLSATASVVPLPFALLERVAVSIVPGLILAPALMLVFLLGPMLWFRHMSLFGLSRSNHALSLPASLLQPLLSIVGVCVLVTPTADLLAEAAVFLVIGFLASALLLRAADRPIRREFGHSGVSMIRPVLDHINQRDPAATAELETFFARFSVPADLRVSLVTVRSGDRTRATIALPTVHPGPFAALGASDLPRRLTERLGADAGMVFVPHTPCNHDLDLPTSQEFEKVAAAAVALSKQIASGPALATASPLVRPYPDSLARAQRLGDAVLVTVTQAPEPTDDIDFAVVDPVVRAAAASGTRLALIDAHNSYVEGEGDLTYATPKAAQLVRDISAAVRAADAVASDRGFRFGVAARTDYDLRRHGIGPAGIRVWVVEVGGRTSAQALIDGNNLVKGARAPILAALQGIVDDAEVMTTDNHIVHEVDGGINPVGERYPAASIAHDVRRLVEAAKTDLATATAASGTVDVPSVRVLQPAWTQRLLTSLGDTVSMFGNALLTTYLLVVTSSLVVLLAVR